METIHAVAIKNEQSKYGGRVRFALGLDDAGLTHGQDSAGRGLGDGLDTRLEIRAWTRHLEWTCDARLGL